MTSRRTNSLAWRGTFSGLTLGATYSLGRDTVNAGSPGGTNCAGNSADAQACREWSTLVKYDRDGSGAAFAYDRIHGGPGAFAGLTNSGLTDSRLVLNGYSTFGAVKLAGGLIRRDNQGSATPRSDLWHPGVVYAPSPLWTIDAEWFRLDVKNSPNRATLLTLRATYFLSKRTAVYATCGHIGNDGAFALSVSSGGPGSAPVAGQSQAGLTTGIRHSF